MARPQDYGDQYPSDVGDVAPDDPTFGYEELNSIIAYEEKEPKKIKPLYSFDKSIIDSEPPVEPKREIVLGQITDIQYDVNLEHWKYKIRTQDGRILGYLAPPYQHPHRQFGVADYVYVVRGHEGGQFFIFGEEYWKQISTFYSYSAVAGISVGTGADGYVPFDVSIGGTGDGIGKVDNATFKCFTAGLYQISYSITLQLPGVQVGGFVTFTTTEAFTTASNTVPSNSVTGYWGCPDPGSTITVTNTSNIFEGGVGAKGIAVWDEIAEVWKIIQLSCPAE